MTEPCLPLLRHDEGARWWRSLECRCLLRQIIRSGIHSANTRGFPGYSWMCPDRTTLRLLHVHVVTSQEAMFVSVSNFSKSTDTPLRRRTLLAGDVTGCALYSVVPSFSGHPHQHPSGLTRVKARIRPSPRPSQPRQNREFHDTLDD